MFTLIENLLFTHFSFIFPFLQCEVKTCEQCMEMLKWMDATESQIKVKPEVWLSEHEFNSPRYSSFSTVQVNTQYWVNKRRSTLNGRLKWRLWNLLAIRRIWWIKQFPNSYKRETSILSSFQRAALAVCLMIFNNFNNIEFISLLYFAVFLDASRLVSTLKCISSTALSDRPLPRSSHQQSKLQIIHEKNLKLVEAAKNFHSELKAALLPVFTELPVSGQWDFPKGWSVTGPSRVSTTRQRTKKKVFNFALEKSSQRYCERRWRSLVFPNNKANRIIAKSL